MRKFGLVAILRLAVLLLLVYTLSAQSLSVVAQTNTEKVVALLHGTRDDVFPITGASGFLVARIHGNPDERHFAVTTYDRFGNLASLLVNTTDHYIGIVPFNFDAYKMHDLDGGLIEVSAEGDWSIEVIELYSLAQVKNTQALGGYGDYVGYVKGSSLTASVYGNEELRHFAVSAIGMNGNSGRGDLLVNTTSLYKGTVRLPSNKDGIVFIVKIPGVWAISLNTSDLDDIFDTRIVTFKSNPYSPFKEILDKSTVVSSPTPTIEPSPTQKATTTAAASFATDEAHNGTVNRDANLRAGPGTNYAVVGAAKTNQRVTIIGKSGDGSWLQLDDDIWIAAFLVNQEQTTPLPPTTTATSTSTSLPTKTPVPTSTPKTPKVAVDDSFESGGLGLDKAEFAAMHTETGKDVMGTIYDDSLIVSFFDGRVGYIERQWSTEAPADAAIVEVWSSTLLPSDATFVESYNPEGRPETTVMLYMSESLSSRFEQWIGGEPGNFIVQYNTFDGHVTRAIISTGNNP